MIIEYIKSKNNERRLFFREKKSNEATKQKKWQVLKIFTLLFFFP